MRRDLIAALLLSFGTVLGLRAELLPATYRDEVVAYSLALKLASTASEAAAEGVSLARVAMLPELLATGSYIYRLRQYEGQKDWSMALEPRLVQTIYGGGVVRADIDKAEISSEIALCDEAFTLLEVAYAADYAYWNLWAMERLRGAMGQYVEIIKSQTEAIERRFEEGYTSKGDLLMMQSRLSEAEYEFISAEQSQLTSLHNLNILRGVSPEFAVSLVDVVPDSLFVPQRVELAEVMEQRPDYAASLLNCELARVTTQATRGAYNPQLKGGATGGWRTHTPNTTGKTYIDGTLYVELSMPIYHFGERRKATAISRLSERTKQIDSELLRDEIAKDESNAWVSIVESKAQMSAATRSLNIASENLQISSYSYNEGLVSIVDLMAAQISWIQNYTNAITAEYDHQIALSAYRRVVGDLETK
ncbi:MAG: TolC family protein [Rikenellaceae bacterium]